MKVQTLSLDTNHNSIDIYTGGDGDIYITIYSKENKDSSETPHSVRLGMNGSGSRIPPDVKKALSKLAAAWEKYKDCDNEFDAERKWLNSQNIN